MPRRAAAEPAARADAVHNSKLVQQVINKVMLDGKKSTAEKIVYDALEMLSRRTSRRRSRLSRTRSRHSLRCSR